MTNRATVVVCPSRDLGSAEVDLGLARTMGQGDEDLGVAPPVGGNGLLDDGQLALIAVLVAEPLENPFGGVALLPGRLRVVLEDLVDHREERLKPRPGSGTRSPVSRGLRMVQDLLKRVSVDSELAADGALALAVDQDATADLSPILHVREHPSASKHGAVKKVNRTFILAGMLGSDPWALRFLTDRRPPPRATFFDRRSQRP